MLEVWFKYILISSSFFFLNFNSIYFFLVEGKGGRFSGGFDINVFQKVHATGIFMPVFIIISCTIEVFYLKKFQITSFFFYLSVCGYDFILWLDRRYFIDA